jgi:hypothetical protein
MFSTSTVVESGQVSNDFWNTSTKAATKHPFIQTQVNMFNCQCTPNFKSAQETKKLKHMFIDEKSTSHLPIKSQVEVNEE